MIDFVRGRAQDRQLLVWLVLIGATTATAVLGLEQTGRGSSAVALGLLTIAFVKIRLVGIHFMELGTAPRALRALFEGYVLVTYTVLAALLLVR